MIHVLASIKVKEEHREKFIEIFKSNVPKVLAEAGCIEYAPTIDFESGVPAQELDSNTVTIIEKWESFDHLKAHFVAPHMLTYRTQVEGMVEHVALKILKPA